MAGSSATMTPGASGWRTMYPPVGWGMCVSSAVRRPRRQAGRRGLRGWWLGRGLVDDEPEGVGVGDVAAVTPGGVPATPAVGQVGVGVEQVRDVLDGHVAGPVDDHVLLEVADQDFAVEGGRRLGGRGVVAFDQVL